MTGRRRGRESEAPDQGASRRSRAAALRDAAVGLRWTIAPGAWNCLRSILLNVRARGGGAVGLSASGHHSAGCHKNESNIECLEHPRHIPKSYKPSNAPKVPPRGGEKRLAKRTKSGRLTNRRDASHLTSSDFVAWRLCEACLDVEAAPIMLFE